MEAPPSPLSSRPKRSAVEGSEFSQPASALDGSTALPFVIPTEAQRSGGDPQFSQPVSALDGSTALPFVIPTEAQRSGGIRSSLNRYLLWMEALPSPLSSRPKRSVVEGSAVLSTGICSGWKHCPPLCHPDRSAAQWRDPQFSQPASAQDGSTALPFVLPTEAYPDFLLRSARQHRVCGFP